MASLTVIIPTYNEENYIEDALHSVRFADEIIVIDSNSTDSTVAIAKRYHCKILTRAFDNFSNQKNHALQYATKDWILFLDADERVPPLLKSEILTTINSPNHEGYKLNFPHFFMNRFLYHHSHNVTRLVKRKQCHFEGSVHEKLIVDGTIGQLEHYVLHYTYKSLEHYIAKKDNYAWFQAEQLLKKNKSVTYFHLVFKPFYRFFHSYFIKQGIRDGIPGLTVVAIDSYGVFSRYVKLLLLKYESNKTPRGSKYLSRVLGDYTIDEYTQQQSFRAKENALKFFNTNTHPKWYHFLLSPQLHFIRSYIFELNFLKGKPGYIKAYLERFMILKQYLFLWAKHRNIT